MNPLADGGIEGRTLDLLKSIQNRSATVGVIGLGYVGLPLGVAAAQAGFAVIGFDIDSEKVKHIANGRSYIDAVPDAALHELVQQRKFIGTDDFRQLAACDVVVICVPTPLTPQREPDMCFVASTSESIAAHLRGGQLIVLESTSYPGTTTEFMKPILERSGLKCGNDFFVGFSPEREDPGNTEFRTATIPKIVSGDGPEAQRLIAAFYGAVVEHVVPVSSPATAEAVKLTENIFRAVNIALVNELKIIYGEMGIDIWEVIEAAKTKPFGYMPFYPGPGLGGHCIPIDPFYLSWRAREFEVPARFIELAGEINIAMPRFVVEKAAEALSRQAKLAVSCARVLVLGLAYKKNVSDIRESPSFRLIELLEARGAAVDYHDPHVPLIPMTREHAGLAGRASVSVTAENLARYDLVLLSTDHDAVDYGNVAKHARLIVDTRNAFGRAGITGSHIVKA